MLVERGCPRGGEELGPGREDKEENGLQNVGPGWDEGGLSKRDWSRGEGSRNGKRKKKRRGRDRSPRDRGGKAMRRRGGEGEGPANDQKRRRPGQVPGSENASAKEKTRVQCPEGWGRPKKRYGWE